MSNFGNCQGKITFLIFMYLVLFLFFSFFFWGGGGWGVVVFFCFCNAGIKLEHFTVKLNIEMASYEIAQQRAFLQKFFIKENFASNTIN